MNIELYQHLPQTISPIAFSIGRFHVRWYSISYIVGFLVAYFVMLSAAKKIKLKNTNYQIRETIFDFLLWNFFAALLGGRVGYVLLYDFDFFKNHPAAIFSPLQNGQLVGFYGMSYHGALLAAVAVSYLFLRRKKISFLVWADMAAPAATLGYFFGRIGNFLNGELYGRITTSGLGMYFTTDPASLRHPSQLYEALLEGLLLFFFLIYFQRKKTFQGQIFCLYLMGYAAARIAVENFRQPDAQIGFIFAGTTLGQLLSLVMFASGAFMYLKLKKEK